MKTQIENDHQLIADSFREYHSSLQRYITYKINNECDAEDLSQDVFVRLMDYQSMLRPETIKSFIYTIAHNLIIDYLRRQYKKQEITSYLYDTSSQAYYETEQDVVARDLEHFEHLKVTQLPAQRRRIYMLSRYEEQSVEEIAQSLQLSRRTVENHLRIGRHEVREFMQECI